MAEYLLPILMLAGLLFGIFSGYPIAIRLGGLALIFAGIGGLPTAFLGTLPGRIFTGTLANWLMLAIPRFVFMGIMLDRSNVARKLLLSLESLLGNRPGGLALAVTFLGIIMAASTRIVGASVVMMGMVALPIMQRQNYDKAVASGVVAATGTSLLTPPLGFSLFYLKGIAPPG